MCVLYDDDDDQSSDSSDGTTGANRRTDDENEMDEEDDTRTEDKTRGASSLKASPRAGLFSFRLRFRGLVPSAASLLACVNTAKNDDDEGPKGARPRRVYDNKRTVTTVTTSRTTHTTHREQQRQRRRQGGLYYYSQTDGRE